MSDVIILDSKEKVMAIKVGDHVRLNPTGREFVVHRHTKINNNRPEQIWFHGGHPDWSNKQVYHIRDEDGSACGKAVWTREELWEAIQNNTYYIRW